MNVGVLDLAVSAVHECVDEKEQQLLGQCFVSLFKDEYLYFENELVIFLLEMK